MFIDFLRENIRTARRNIIHYGILRQQKKCQRATSGLAKLGLK